MTTLTDDGARRLANAIIFQAVHDYRKGNRTMAPVVTDGTGGVPMLRTGFETREIGFCCVAPERIIAPEMLGVQDPLTGLGADIIMTVQRLTDCCNGNAAGSGNIFQ